MGKIPTDEELKQLTADELIDRYNQEAKTTCVGTGFYLDELSRRDSEKTTKSIAVWTLALSAISLLIALTALFSAFSSSRNNDHWKTSQLNILEAMNKELQNSHSQKVELFKQNQLPPKKAVKTNPTVILNEKKTTVSQEDNKSL